MAAKNGCNEVAQLLLVHGADVNAKTNVRPLPDSSTHPISFHIHLRMIGDAAKMTL